MSKLWDNLEPDADIEGLTEDQSKYLLKNAERRLRDALTSPPGSTALSDHVGRQALFKLPKLNAGTIAQPYIISTRGIARADASLLLSSHDKHLVELVREVKDPVKQQSRINEAQKASAGSQWFNLPRTNLTPEIKRDVQLLRMRSVLDPKRHYKKENIKDLAPKFSQAGTIIEGPADFYSSRLPKKDRKKTFADEVLAAEDWSGRFRSKYNDIQSAKTSGKRAFYKQLKEKRSGGIRKG